MKFVERLCWAFFACVAIIEGKTVILWSLRLLDWGKPDWAAWVQAVGSIAAIWGAFHIGAKQGKDAIAAIVYGYDLATRRKYEAYSNIAKAAKEHCERTLYVFPENEFNGMLLVIAQLDKKRERLINALEGIPVHDLGVFDAQDALHELRISMVHLNTAVEKANEHLAGFDATLPLRTEFPTDTIRLCCNNAIRHADELIFELARPFKTDLQRS